MKARSLTWFACALLGVAGTSCRKAAAPDPSPAAAAPSAVAVVAGTEISEGALRAELRRRFRHVPEAGLSDGQKREVLERLIQNEAIYAQAQAIGFEQTPEMQARIKQLVVAQFREQRFTNATPPVNDAEIEAAYQANDARFASPAAVRGAAILLQVPRTATAEKQAEMRKRAEAVLAEAGAAADEAAFAQVVARHSEDQASRYRGGDLGWMTRDGVGAEPALAEALFALEQPGALAPLIQTARGYFIAKLLEKRHAGRKPLAEVRETLRYELAREKAAQAESNFHATMKAGLDITVNRDLLESISLPPDKNEPPRMPGPTTAQSR